MRLIVLALMLVSVTANAGDVLSGTPAPSPAAPCETCAGADTHAPKGALDPPMRISSQAPVQSLRLGLLPVVVSSLQKGETQVEVSATWTNVWINAPNMLLDYEALDSRLTVGWGVSESVLLEIGIDERGAFGGFLDPLIQNFHDQIGNGLNGRDAVPRGTVNIEIRDPESGEVVVERRSSGPFSRGVTATIARTAETPRGRLAYAATARTPLGYSGEELSSSTDVGISAAWSGNFRGRSLHVGGGLTRFGQTDVDGIRVKRLQRTGFAAVVQPVTHRTSVIVQYLFNEGIAATGSLGRHAHEVTIGGRMRIANRTSIDFGLIENVLNYDNGPDFGIHFAIVRSSP